MNRRKSTIFGAAGRSKGIGQYAIGNEWIRIEDGQRGRKNMQYL